MQLFLPITKVDAAKRLVYGTLAEEVPDRAGEIFDYASSKPNFARWSAEIAKASDGRSLGNLRAMHGKVAAGKLAAHARTSPDALARRVEVLGPSAAPIARLRGRYRFRVMLRAKERGPLRAVIGGVLREVERVDRRVRVVIDVDPVAML